MAAPLEAGAATADALDGAALGAAALEVAGGGVAPPQAAKRASMIPGRIVLLNTFKAI